MCIEKCIKGNFDSLLTVKSFSPFFLHINDDNKYILMMVLGIFFYVGAEVSMSSKIAIFFSEHYHVDLTKLGMIGVGVFFLSLTIGRFLGSVILNWMKPAKFLLITSILSFLGILVLFFD